MLAALVALSALNLLLLLVLLSRKSTQPDTTAELRTKMDTFSEGLRSGVEQIRRDADASAQQARSETARTSSELRSEVTQSIAVLGKTLNEGLNGFRADNTAAAEALRTAVQNNLDTLNQRLSAFISDANRQQMEAREALHARLNDLGAKQAEALDKINRENSAKLDLMRQTVDEKLQRTLHERITQSFGQVTTHLGEVQKGLGEMKELATGVSDLKKVFSNVKSRGVVGEFMLGQLMEQMFSPEQYERNAKIKRGTQETVEYALKVPVAEGETAYLAIDSKFPQGDWERLEQAYDSGSAEEIATARKAFNRSIRVEGDRICKKYIDEPATLPYAVMYLPTENLYAEVLREPGLVTALQQECRVMIAGPSTFMHMMANFRMGFRTIAIQKKGGEVWKVLGAAKKEFENFAGLMEKVNSDVNKVQNTLEKIRSKTTTINRALKNVDSEVAEMNTGRQETIRQIEEIASVAPLLAAVEDNESEASSF